jgi:hypothetical protein
MAEHITSERLANAAAIVAECIELDGPVYMPIFKRLMREYKAAIEDEKDLALALSWHRDGYQAPNIKLKS